MAEVSKEVHRRQNHLASFFVYLATARNNSCA